MYSVEMPAPSGSYSVKLPYEGVVHLRYAYSPEQAWRGLSPLDFASEAARMDANINKSPADEAAMPTGGILPLAEPGDDDDGDDKTEIEFALGKLRGKIMTTESQSQAAPGGYLEQPRGDWLVQRVGADYKLPLVQHRRDADELILGICGIPIEFLKGADGSALREAYRRMLFGTIQPLGAIVASELSEKLDADVSFRWDELRAADRAAGARAYKSLREAGMPEADALRLSGL